MTPDKQTKKGKPTRLPTVLSVVYPGLGQFAQRRFIAGTIFLIVCTAFFIQFMVSAGSLIIAYCRLAFDPSSQIEAPGYGPMLTWFVLVLLIYIASVWDAHRAFLRQRQSWSRQAHDIPPDLPDD
jgi:hypothetical protein